MDIHFPSPEAVQYIFSYDTINASFPGKETARADWAMLPEAHTWKWTLAIAVLSNLSFALWRLWKFTVRPWIYPDEPREIPYWVPCKVQMSCAVTKAEQTSRFRYSVLEPDLLGVK